MIVAYHLFSIVRQYCVAVPCRSTARQYRMTVPSGSVVLECRTVPCDVLCDGTLVPEWQSRGYFCVEGRLAGSLAENRVLAGLVRLGG
jgi:hypothetical protein